MHGVWERDERDRIVSACWEKQIEFKRYLYRVGDTGIRLLFKIGSGRYNLKECTVCDVEYQILTCGV